MKVIQLRLLLGDSPVFLVALDQECDQALLGFDRRDGNWSDLFRRGTGSNEVDNLQVSRTGMTHDASIIHCLAALASLS